MQYPGLTREIGGIFTSYITGISSIFIKLITVWTFSFFQIFQTIKCLWVLRQCHYFLRIILVEVFCFCDFWLEIWRYTYTFSYLCVFGIIRMKYVPIKFMNLFNSNVTEIHSTCTIGISEKISHVFVNVKFPPYNSLYYLMAEIKCNEIKLC